ncbi:sugar transferase [Paludisphaera mucosa]|uniref:Sugar transferase n=1 Tax=Paludisphaera mucosa TaxID=3030827 RepID=A0ABT6FKL8_9BACT|nr:sugar transferase [Paludisphaera mucosa]MDG3008118.1 sugar transferase [Paludisphaera mucosa]
MIPQQDELQLPALLSLQSNWPSYAEAARSHAKRAIDFSGALVGLLLLAPVMLAVALLIRFDSPGPIFFRQLRRGHRGRLFWVIKFRTMQADAEQKLDELEGRNESAGGVLFKIKNDPRVTPLGRFLRKSSLDELPQLINILRGEMSVVGPRPLQLRDSEMLQSLDREGYRRRLQVMPGLTGPWQVGGRSAVDYSRMVELDVEYANNWSIFGDLVIIVRTFIAVIVGRGAC